MNAQNTVAQAMESADPHAAKVIRNHAFQTREHFFGGLVGKGHRQNLTRRRQIMLKQPGDARGQHSRLAGSRAGKNKDALFRCGHCPMLLGIEVGQNIARHRQTFDGIVFLKTMQEMNLRPKR